MVSGVVRVGETVRKPPLIATQTMRDVLRHLERVGFDAAPRWLGIDDRGRDILTYIAGDTLSDTGTTVFSDQQLAASARLLRYYHDTFDADVICHGDFGPWNLVWRDGEPVAMIDFDNAHAGPPLDDIGYALWKFLNPGLVRLDWDEQRRRARVFLDAYGADLDPRAAIAHGHAQARARFLDHGWPVDALDSEIAWLVRYGSD
jgi:aminoglycoside phosphotransferase (APT) family kinase protein